MPNVHSHDVSGVVRYVGFISSVWLDGVDRGQSSFSSTDPNRLSYSAKTVWPGYPQTFENLSPGVRVTRTALVNSAQPGQPCDIICFVGKPPILSVIEEIVFAPCPPVVPTGGA